MGKEEGRRPLRFLEGLRALIDAEPVSCQLSQPDDVPPNRGCETIVAGTVGRLDAGTD